MRRGFLKIRGTFVGVPIVKDYSFWVYTGLPLFRKLPDKGFVCCFRAAWRFETFGVERLGEGLGVLGLGFRV